MSDNIVYRFYSPGDEDGIISLLKASFPGWKEHKSALKSWRWKYLESPIKPMIRIVLDGDNIVAVDHKIITRVKIGDATHLATYSDDVAVHTDYRSRGIYSEMLKLANVYRKENNISYAYYSTTNPIVSNTDTKQGFRQFPFYISHLVKIIESDRYLKDKKRDDLVIKMGVKVLTGFSSIKQALATQPKSIGDYSIVDVSQFDDSIDTFWDEVKDSYSYIIEKKMDYLNWRNRKPTENNSVKVAVDGNRILGYIVLSLDKEEDHLEGKISDLLTLPDRMDVADALVKSACDFLESKGVAAIYYPATKGHPYEELAERNGFIDASRLKSTYFYYYIISAIPNDYIENLSPLKVQLHYF